MASQMTVQHFLNSFVKFPRTYISLSFNVRWPDFDRRLWGLVAESNKQDSRYGYLELSINEYLP